MQEQEQEEKKAPVPLATKIGMIALPMLPTIAIDMIAHGGITPPALAAFGLSWVAFDRSPRVLAWLGENQAFLSYLQTHPETLVKFDRLTNRYFSGQLKAHKMLPAESCATEKAQQLPEQTQQQRVVTQADEQSLLEDMETLQPKPLASRRSEDDLQSLEDILQRSDNTLPGRCVFSTVLRAFMPSKEKIFLGYLPGGQAVYVTLEDLCHVALAGLTGNGKTTLIRLLVSQLEYVGAKVLILNPHYTSYDIKKHEDWTPIERHLYRPPVTDFVAIGGMMRWAATVLLRDRLEKYRQSTPWGSPIFIVIDELPAIVNEVREFPEYVSAILREGRKVDIFLIVASQDFLTKTIGPDEGGAVRKNYKTKMYVGGDVTTAKVLLDMPPAQIPEDQLGGGIIMMRNQAVKTASLARVPYVDNEAIYTLLGPSTYVASKREAEEEEDDLIGGLMNGEHAETDTEPLPAQTRQHMRVSSYEQHRQKIANRKVPVYVEQSRRTETKQKSDLDLALEAYDAGNTTIDALAIAINKTAWTVRPLYAQVKRIREQK